MKRRNQNQWVGVGVVILLFVIGWVGMAFAFDPTTDFFNQALRQTRAGTSWWDITLDRVGQHLVAAILGGFFGAFFSQKLQPYRRKLMVVLFILGGIAGILASVVLGNIVIFLFAAVIVYNWLRVAIAKAVAKREKPTTFGSAEWADLDHLTQNDLIGIDGFSLGIFETRERAYPLCYTGDRHLMTIAPTRSGKGVSSIIPNLLAYRGSAVVIDPKGENAMITAPRRGKGDTKRGIQGMGQTVHVVDPWGITGLPSSCFNPLDWLNPDDPDINENAMILADSIITPHAGSKDQFWDEEAKALLVGILLHVATSKETDNRTMGHVRDIISMSNEDLNDILGEMVESQNPIVSSAGARTLSKEDKLKSNVLASLQSHTHFLDSPSIRASLATSDFSFEDLKTTKMTVYLVLPADRLGAFGRWLRLLIQQALTVNARNIEIKPDKPILFLLDEMATLGRLSMVEEAYGLMAGFGMQLWGIVQDLSQLHRIYGNGWQTFIGNSGVIQYFGSRDLMTAEYFSKMCGVTTIEKVSIGSSLAKAFSFSSGSGNSSSSQSTTYSDSYNTDLVGRPLAYPDELMVMRDNKQVVFIESFNPVPARKVPWFDNEDLRRHGVNLHKEPSGPKNGNPKRSTPAPPPPSEEPAPEIDPERKDIPSETPLTEEEINARIGEALYIINGAGYEVSVIAGSTQQFSIRHKTKHKKAQTIHIKELILFAERLVKK